MNGATAAGRRALRAAAVDLGASGGRVVVGTIGADRLDVVPVHRFGNEPKKVGNRLVWDLPALWDGVLAGLSAAVRAAPLASVGVDTWAVDYGLLDGAGELLGPPVHYRDPRTDGRIAQVAALVGAERLYQITGLQVMPFNTVYQLLAENPAVLARTSTLLLLPDLLGYRLTGTVGAERTNASTTQLYDATRRCWADDLITAVGLPRGIFPGLRDPGTVIGTLLPAVSAAVGASPGLVVAAVGSHDTASAVAAVPATDPGFAYISCGTWSLVGVELDRPVLSAASRAANFTNEAGVDGTVRYLRNVMGLWPLQECLREWAAAGDPVDLAVLLRAAAEEPAGRSVVDAESSDFLAPGDMPARIRTWCRAHDQPVPITRPALARCVIDSLALGHARNVARAARLAGRRVEVVHIVGGGSRNALLCQLTADACGLPVVAGPAEATAIGNLLVQARAHGVLADRFAARALVARTQPLRRYEPRDAARPPAT